MISLLYMVNPLITILKNEICCLHYIVGLRKMLNWTHCNPDGSNVKLNLDSFEQLHNVDIQKHTRKGRCVCMTMTAVTVSLDFVNLKENSPRATAQRF